MRLGYLLCVLSILVPLGAEFPFAPLAAVEPRRTENVLIVTWDGFRWQEFFSGAEAGLLNKEFGGVRDVEGLRQRYWRETAAERRGALLPFVWGTIAKQGQIFGDASRQSPMRLTNGKKFSYPGYHELFCGFADPRIDANARLDNPNLSVLEFLHEKPAYKDRVAAFCTWDIFPFIFRRRTSGLLVHTGWNPIVDPPLTDRQSYANELLEALPRYWPDNVFDVITLMAAREHLLRHRPRVLYLGLGETDEWGHGRRYDLYLDAAHHADRQLAKFWQTLQQLPQYKDKTSLLLTTDHGRGQTRTDWTDHGETVPGAEFVWAAVLGPDTPALGVREGVSTTQGQVAATIAALLAENFRAAAPRAAPPLPDAAPAVPAAEGK